MATNAIQPEPDVNLPPFKNERIFPGVDDPTVQTAFPEAIAKIRNQLGRTYPLYINGQDVTTGVTLDSLNPADPEEVVGTVCQADKTEAEQALTHTTIMMSENTVS